MRVMHDRARSTVALIAGLRMCMRLASSSRPWCCAMLRSRALRVWNQRRRHQSNELMS
jgi:hypothetical protein